MYAMLWPMALVVAANILYNISTKSMPAASDPFVALVFAYAIACLLSLGGYFLFGGQKNFMQALGAWDWTWISLAMAMFGLEVGFIFMYRAGWAISIGSTVANILLAIALVIVGYFCYQEKIGLRELAGIILCVSGLALLMPTR